MDSSVSPNDEIWFLRVCHHISTGLYLDSYQRTFHICFNCARLRSLLLLRIPSYERGHFLYLHFQIDRLVANTPKQFSDMKSFYVISASCVCWCVYWYTSCQHGDEKFQKMVMKSFKKWR